MTAAKGVSSNGCVEKKRDILAPQVGFEPTTLRLTAEQLIAASLCKQKSCRRKSVIFREFGGTLGVPLRYIQPWSSELVSGG
jgi:hypothetical protein